MAFGSASAVGRIGMLRPCFVQACAFGLVSAECGRNAELRENRILEEGGAGCAALSWA